MKKVIAMVLTLCMVLALCACGQKAAPAETPAVPEAKPSEEPSSDSKEYVIAVVPKVLGAAWFVRMEEGVVQFAQDTGADAYMTGPAQADAATQAQYVQDLIAAGVDALCVVPYSTEAMEPVLKQAREAGIVVVTHEAQGMTNIDYDIEAFNNDEYGRHMMERLAEIMDYQGELVEMVGSLTSASHMQWADGADAVIAENNYDITVYGDRVETEDTQETAYKKTVEILKANPEIDGIFGTSMIDIPGAAQAVEEAGLSGKVKLCGTSLVSVAGKYLEDGTIDTIFFWDPASAGYAMCALAVKLLNGEEVGEGLDLGIDGYRSLKLEGNTFIGNAWVDVTKDNMADYDF